VGLKIFIDYFLPLLIMVLAAVLYFRVALNAGIIDRPNQRSSHNVPTIRGGGIIFLVAAVLFLCWNGFYFPYLMMALLVSGGVSFIDDIRTLPNWVRFGSHFISVILLLVESGLLMSLIPMYLVAIIILAIGVINAYNFMDGINGMTGLYSLAVIFPLYLAEQNSLLASLELFFILGLLVFNFYNTRKRAVCFAGDVGSISLAIIIVFLLMVKIVSTQNFSYIGLLLVYGIDSGFTIFHRLLHHENIFSAHRKHLYQFLTNEKKIPQLWISSIYSSLQLILNLLIVFGHLGYLEILTIFVVLSLIYWIIKAPILKVTQVNR